MRDFGLNKKFLLLKIPTEPRYCARLTSISKERDLIHSGADIKYTIDINSKTNLNV